VSAQTANSIAASNSNSASHSNSASDAQSAAQQAQSANNAGNAQAITFNSPASPTRTSVDFKTNNSVPLVAGVSFSSDYCGGTASGGASAAGISVGASKPIMDRNCQAIRRAQTFGMLSANAKNLGNVEQANRLMAMSIYEICESGLGDKETITANACLSLGLVVLGDLPGPRPLNSPTPQEASPQDMQRASNARAAAETQAIQPSPVTIKDDRGREVPATQH
jgi:hypothetical protein